MAKGWKKETFIIDELINGEASEPHAKLSVENAVIMFTLGQRPIVDKGVLRLYFQITVEQIVESHIVLRLGIGPTSRWTVKVVPGLRPEFILDDGSDDHGIHTVGLVALIPIDSRVGIVFLFLEPILESISRTVNIF